MIAVYCPAATSITIDYNYGALAMRSTADYTCRVFESDDNGVTWLTNHWPFTYARNNQTPTSNLGDFIRANKDVTATYTENWYGAWGFNLVTAGDKLINGSSFGGFVATKQLHISRSPELGGGVSDYPTGENILCGIDSYEICQASFPLNTEVTLDAQHNEGYEFSHWEINDLAMADVDGSIDVTMSENKNVKAVFYLKADDFVFPVLAQGVTDPLLNNTLNPDGNGWDGPGVGEHSAEDGHLGQDYVMDSGNGDGNAAGEPVYAVANGTIVEVMNNQNTSYGWCDNDHHGWGPVVVIRHENRDGFNTSGSIVTGSCDTETNPTVIYSLYGHLSKTSIQNLQIGQTVAKGQYLGELGDYYAIPSEQPWSTNHLHFEFKDEVGYTEGTWYKTPANEGVCPQSTNYTTCSSYLVKGVGTAYSMESNFAPHRYEPGAFINLNQ
ncbi:MAG: peptidoglycan DD-metalloendopeptidase family protein [Candidatus Moranbacteria bacterium]|nr:peptidoglycan DD-metalloendopeptidase family protein [Candidatus Moranbacteria bacterium]